MSDVPGPPVSPHGDSENGSGIWYGQRHGPPEYASDRVQAGRDPWQAYGGPDRPGQPPGGDTIPVPVVDPAQAGPRQDPWTAVRHLAPARTETMKIGMWGSPGSGKSTFLAALQHATSTAHRSLGSWKLFPLTEQSKELLVMWNQQLVADRVFPEPTAFGTAAELRWGFRGDLAGSRYQPTWRRLAQATEPSAFDLDLIDVNGEVFGPRPDEKNVPMELVVRTLNHLADARGLIFLFDPITERRTPTVAQYLNRTLMELLTLIESRGGNRRDGGFLPHHISVCVTKFDDPELFQQACRAGFVNSGADGRPRIPPRHAEAFFNALCEGRFWAENDERGTYGPTFVRNMLNKYFHPERIRYYVTSSIGFNLGADSQFDPARYAMVREQEKGKRIIGPIDPINVLEPLVELHLKLRRRG